MLSSALYPEHMEYCATVYAGCDARTSGRMQVAQNACVRFVCSVARRDSVTAHKRRMALLSVRDRRKLLALVVFYRIKVM